jgi:hypothetical protein
MNKLEKIMEYIINDETDKARALFHEVVVEKSRDIYESMMSDEGVHGAEVEDLTDEVTGEEAMEGEEGADEAGFGGEEEFGDEEGEFGEPEGEVGGEEGEHAEIEDQVMNIDAKLDELLSKFDEIMGGEEGAGDEFGGEEGAGDEFGGEEGGEEPAGEFGGEEEGEEESFAPVAESAEEEEEEEEEESKEPKGKKVEETKKSVSELMREYVEKVGDIYGGQGDAAEGTIVGANTGAKDKASVNKSSIGGPGADFGGTTQNIVTKKGNTNATPDGTGANKGEDNYGKKGQGKLIGNVGNTPGGKKSLKQEGPGYDKAPEGQEGKPAGAKQTMGANVNKKSELGQSGQPTGKKK